jgi:hypothetical protein
MAGIRDMRGVRVCASFSRRCRVRGPRHTALRLVEADFAGELADPITQQMVGVAWVGDRAAALIVVAVQSSLPRVIVRIVDVRRLHRGESDRLQPSQSTLVCGRSAQSRLGALDSPSGRSLVDPT